MGPEEGEGGEARTIVQLHDAGCSNENSELRRLISWWLLSAIHGAPLPANVFERGGGLLELLWYSALCPYECKFSLRIHHNNKNTPNINTTPSYFHIDCSHSLLIYQIFHSYSRIEFLSRFAASASVGVLTPMSLTLPRLDFGVLIKTHQWLIFIFICSISADRKRLCPDVFVQTIPAAVFGGLSAYNISKCCTWLRNLVFKAAIKAICQQATSEFRGRHHSQALWVMPSSAVHSSTAVFCAATLVTFTRRFSICCVCVCVC